MNYLFEAQEEDAEATLLVFPEVEADVAESVAVDVTPVLMQVHTGNEATLESLSKLATEAQLEAAREEGRDAAFAECVKRLREGLEIERTAVSHVCTSFTKERERYFAEIEGEVVRLSLAIAARVLQRESTMDPTLLAGVVRVALQKLSEPKGAVLRMNEEDVESWHKAMRHSGLVIEADRGMKRGELRLESPGGVAELGVAAQLVEIERGFFDLLARRPA